MHLAYVCSDLGVPISGTKGASIHVRSLAQALSLRGHRVSLLAANPGEDPLVGFRPRIFPIGYDRTLKRLKKRVGEKNPGSTKDREIYALLLGNLAFQQLARLHRERPIDAIYERHSLWSWAALAFAREHDIPHLLEVNAPLVREQRTYRTLALADVADSCERELVAGSSGIIVPSKALARHAARLGARSKAIHILPNAIDPDLFRSPASPPPHQRARLADRFVIAFLGSLKPWHGVEILIDAFGRLLESTKRAHLLVLGDGPLRGRIEETAARFGRDNVTAMGAVSHGSVPGWLGHAHVGVAPYPAMVDFYFSPMKVVEYQASGLAVVASDLGHLRDQIEDRRTGLLVPPGDPVRLAGALAQLARQPDMARRMGDRARRHVLRNHTWGQVAARVERLIGESLPEHRLARAAGGDS